MVSNCGAEAIPFLKLYAVMPCATAFIVIYSKLSNALGKQALFYTTLVPFFVFYGVFAFVLFPMRDRLHFPLAAAATAGAGGGGAGGAAMNLLRYWSFSLFFIVSELWASAGVPLLFWQVRDIFILFVVCDYFVWMVPENEFRLSLHLCSICYHIGILLINHSLSSQCYITAILFCTVRQ